MKKISLNNLKLNNENALSNEEKKKVTGGGCPLICYDCPTGMFCYDSCMDHPYPCS